MQTVKDAKNILRRFGQLLPVTKLSNHGMPRIQRSNRDDDEILLPIRASPSLPLRTVSTSWVSRTGCLDCVVRRLRMTFFIRPSLRKTIYALFLVFLLIALGVLWNGIPPDFDSIRGYERRLPQHNLSLPRPEGVDGMYIRFPDHLWGHGFNNVLQEMQA